MGGRTSSDCLQRGNASARLRMPLVFVDAVAAVYSVVRDALWGPFRTLRCTRKLFEEFGFGPVLGEELWHQLQVEPAAAEVIGVPERERQIMADWYVPTCSGQAWLEDELFQGQNRVHHETRWPWIAGVGGGTAVH